MNNQLKTEFYELMTNFPSAHDLLTKLSKEGDLLLFGGAVRSFFENSFKILPRDFDIVVNTDIDIESYFRKYEFKKNRYGGFKVIIDSLEFDIWTMKNTWAFKENKVTLGEENLAQTVFLNLDSIVYNLNKDKLYDESYKMALSTKVLDVVLQDNPHPELNLLRALVFKKKYHMIFSYDLKKCFKEHLNDKEKFLSNLNSVQYSHYGREVLTTKEIREEISYL